MLAAKRLDSRNYTRSYRLGAKQHERANNRPKKRILGTGYLCFVALRSDKHKSDIDKHQDDDDGPDADNDTQYIPEESFKTGSAFERIDKGHA
jgi:hypothetical protein